MINRVYVGAWLHCDWQLSTYQSSPEDNKGCLVLHVYSQYDRQLVTDGSSIIECTQISWIVWSVSKVLDTSGQKWTWFLSIWRETLSLSEFDFSQVPFCSRGYTVISSVPQSNPNLLIHKIPIFGFKNCNFCLQKLALQCCKANLEALKWVDENIRSIINICLS